MKNYRSRTQKEPCHCGAKAGERCIAYRSGKRMTYFHQVVAPVRLTDQN